MSKGPAKGTSTAKPRHILDTSPQKQRERAARRQRASAEENAAVNERAQKIMGETGIGFRKARARAWREFHPEWEGKEDQLSPKDVRGYIMSGIPDVIDAAFRIAADPKHPRQWDAIKGLVDQGIGKAPGSLDVNAKGDITITFTDADSGVL